MTKKIIVADDSQTIQKVIKITFAKKDFELIPCLDEKSLLDNLSDEIDLILLDFSLSETKSGYILGAEVKSKYSHIPLLGLMGTFDTVDDEKFLSSGFSNKVVKPFETENFINICDELIENSTGTTNFPSDDIEEDLEGDDWNVSNSVAEEDYVEEDDFSNIQNLDSPVEDELSKELGGWGLTNPDLSKSDVTQDFGEFPPVIEDTSMEERSEDIASKFLSVDNLINDEDFTEESSEDDAQEDLLSEDDLLEEELDNAFDSAGLSEESEEDISAENLWAVDAISENVEEIDSEDAVTEVGENTEEIQINLPHRETVDEKFHNEIREKLASDLNPIVEKYVQDYCRERLEQVAWEIIPDLAENLIKKELKNISKSILESMNDK